MSDIRILLLCSNRFALQTMQELAFFRQLAAVAIPSHCDEWREHAAAALNGSEVPILILQKASYISQLHEAFAQYQANMGLMVTFSFLVPAEVYTIPEKGFFNVHPGSLPAYRGPDPVFYQIRNREAFAEVSVHHLSEIWDAGPIVMRERIELLPTDTHGLLSYRLSLRAARLCHNLVKMAGFGLPLPSKAQDEAKAVYHKRQTPRDVNINWGTMSAVDIVALINACNPWNKGASTRIGQKVIRFTEAALVPGTAGAEPGTVLGFQDREMNVACRDSQVLAVRIVTIDEGILPAARLFELGIQTGLKFETLTA